MSLNLTTLSGAIGATDTQLGVASATGITAPNFTTGANVTYLFIENELLLVEAVSGTFISVVRGQMGTVAAAHGNTAGVAAGLVSDFPNFQPSISAFAVAQGRYAGVFAPVPSAATIVAPGPTFHVTGTVATNIITPPANFLEGKITIIADGVWTFTSSAVTNGIAATGTVTTAKSVVEFTYDVNTALWYPSRLA